jgi:hypothetical protein
MSAHQPKTIFLDQNHWIYLARAVNGDPHRPEHVATAERLLRLVDRAQVRLPLSTMHLIEHLRSADVGRRQRLAEVFENFSRGWFFAAWGSIISAEISRAVAKTFRCGPVPAPIVVGRGFMFGLSSRMRALVESQLRILPLEQVSAVAALPGALLHLLTFPNEAGRTRQNTAIGQSGRKYAADTEQLRNLRKPASRTLVKRAQYARYTYDFQEEIGTALAVIGRRWDDWIALGPVGLTEFWDSVPSFRVDADLTLYRDRQWPRPVDPNDLGDISHLVLAVPYCDIVVVEHFWARAVAETQLATEYSTDVCTDLSQLNPLLDRLAAD